MKARTFDYAINLLRGMNLKCDVCRNYIGFTVDVLRASEYIEYHMRSSCRCSVALSAYRDPINSLARRRDDFMPLVAELVRTCRPSLYLPSRPRTPDPYSMTATIYNEVQLRADIQDAVKYATTQPSYTASAPAAPPVTSDLTDFLMDEIELNNTYIPMRERMAREVMRQFMADPTPSNSAVFKKPSPPPKAPQKEEPRKISWDV